MNPEAQLIAIAQAHGYTDVRREVVESVDAEERNIVIVEGTRGTKNGQRYWIPRYLSDLNASHEMEEKVNNSKDAETYGRLLAEIVLGFPIHTGSATLNYWATMRVARATALQRACAFLKTLGLWREDL
jgi:hypothetical protein